MTALLGAIVLAITGAEALYADMGHFGRRYIAWAWYGAALPGLVLNYFGQGAYMLSHPGPRKIRFSPSLRGPDSAVLTGLSIVAAIIASQALITGAYSLARQAIQLGYFPRLKINYTNADIRPDLRAVDQRVLAMGCIFTALVFGPATGWRPPMASPSPDHVDHDRSVLYRCPPELGWSLLLRPFRSARSS